MVRQYSPAITIGGGVILDPSPRLHGRFRDEVLSHLRSLEREDPGEVIETLLRGFSHTSRTAAQIAKDTGIIRSAVDEVIAALLSSGTLRQLGTPQQPSYILSANLDTIKEEVLHHLADFHQKQPLKTGVSRAELREMVDSTMDVQVLNHIVEKLCGENAIKESASVLALSSFQIVLSEKDKTIQRNVADVLLKARFSTPGADDLSAQLSISSVDLNRVLAAMRGLGEVFKLEGDLYFHRDTIAEARTLLEREFKPDEEISVSAFRELLETTRRFALAILLYFDHIGVTERIGETRILKK